MSTTITICSYPNFHTNRHIQLCISRVGSDHTRCAAHACAALYCGLHKRGRVWQQARALRTMNHSLREPSAQTAKKGSLQRDTSERSQLTKGRSETLCHEERDAKEAGERYPLSLFQALILALKGKFAVDNWQANKDPQDLQKDVIDMNTNLGIVGALFLSFTFTVLVSDEVYDAAEALKEGANITSGSDVPQWLNWGSDLPHWLTIVIMALLSFASLVFSSMVLVSVANLTIVQLVHEDAMKIFTLRSKQVLLLPMRLLLLGTTGIVWAIYAWGCAKFGFAVASIVFFGTTIPTLVLLLWAFANGVRDLYQANATIEGYISRYDLESRRYAQNRISARGSRISEGDRASERGNV